ncbi:MAG: right-handed parallel beta-helix repeat-containing protein, partial [Calditrichia bacterium]|nr:right-handed parallel beta-helix repeat-containing protein [Calditrichia bacterium]
MKIIIINITLLCLIGFLRAQTIIPGGTISGDTWVKAGSPYIIQNDVTIEDLIIHPGVSVEFTGNHKFDINANLQASGLYSDSIYFKPYVSNSVGWEGIKFKNGSSPNNVLRYCRIEQTNNPAIQVDNSRPTIENCRVVHNDNDGIYVKNSSLQIKNCIIRYN